jgi:ATP-binding cassette subfamily B multidrug efflux pump
MALEIAQAKDFVSELPEKLEARVAQGGTNFSGGQRQRLSIARAIVKRPKIYILDDSFSALDYSTDAKLRAALDHEAANATVLIVAQRVSTILNADQIIVLDNGQIVGIGTHQKLMGTCDTYREIVLSQLSPEEAA